MAVFDGAFIKMYVDGKLLCAQESKVKKLPRGDKFYLRYPATYLTVEPEYKCRMDDVRVYNRVLSEAEVVRHCQQQAKATGRHEATWFDKAKLIPHAFPESAKLVVEADITQMSLQSPGSMLKIELRDGGGKTAARHETPVQVRPRDTDQEPAIRLEFEDIERLGISYWTLGVKEFPAGDYEVRAVVADKSGKQIGVPSSVGLKLPLNKPDWIKAYDGVKVLNNLAAELLNVPTPSIEKRKEYTFANPRAGWVFVSSTAAVKGTDRVLISIESAPEDAAIVHAKGEGQTLEAMRYLPAGVHKLLVRCEGATRPTALVVRAIPEMMVAGLGYSCGSGWPNVPILPCFGRYNGEYLKRIGILDNTNVIIEQNPLPENAPYVEQWRKQGKKLIVRYSMWPIWQLKGMTADSIFKAWTEDRGLADNGYDGIIGDEFSGCRGRRNTPCTPRPSKG